MFNIKRLVCDIILSLYTFQIASFKSESECTFSWYKISCFSNSNLPSHDLKQNEMPVTMNVDTIVLLSEFSVTEIGEWISHENKL